MRKEETLLTIKEVEDRVRRSKGEAFAERDKVLREARRETFDLKESLRATAEKRQEEILRETEVATVREKEQVLAEGRRQADTLRAEAEANLERAVERLIEKFKGALHD